MNSKGLSTIFKNTFFAFHRNGVKLTHLGPNWLIKLTFLLDANWASIIFSVKWENRNANVCVASQNEILTSLFSSDYQVTSDATRVFSFSCTFCQRWQRAFICCLWWQSMQFHSIDVTLKVLTLVSSRTGTQQRSLARFSLRKIYLTLVTCLSMGISRNVWNMFTTTHTTKIRDQWTGIWFAMIDLEAQLLKQFTCLESSLAL